MKRECTSQLTFRNPRVSIGFALYAAGLVLAMAFIESVVAGDNDTAELSQSVPTHAPGKWKATGDLGTARFSHTSTLLLNGQVLVAGGVGSDLLTSLASAELYDPATGVWTATGSMHSPRESHTATLLLPVVRFPPASAPNAILNEPVVLFKSAFAPSAVFLFPLVLLLSAE